MKSYFVIIACLVLFFMTSCSSTKTTPEIVSEITQKVQSKDFIVQVNYANPLRWGQMYLNSDYDLRIKNDSAFAYLPYFGVAHSAPYGTGEGGIKFAEPMSNYSITNNKKSNGWDIRFKVKAKGFDYDVFLNVFNNGSTMFTVNSFNRDAISFNGEIKK